ncbi:MAG TPA: hypothetical protein VMC83_06535 [Streptosporangiaceae bacterium]|nr:hypothetical protein [Streptosporangiaceae bacterium]
MAEAPLTTLLSWAWVAFAIEVDNAVEEAGSERTGRLFRLSIAMWVNGLRCIGEDGITVDELRAQARAACNLAGLERWRWITVGDPGGGRRDGYGTQRGVKGAVVLRPTRAGSYARRLWPQAVADVEQRWRSRFGDAAVGSLRDALLVAVTPSAEQLPWAPPEVHPSDGLRSHVVSGTVVSGTVASGTGADVTGADGGVPFGALMGQALTALTLEHERGSAVSLPLAADVLRVIGDGVVPIRDLPRLSGVSKEAVAMGTGFLSRGKLAEIRPGRLITLTARGHAALEDYRVRAARITDPRLRAGLEAVVSQRDALAEGLRPPERGWRAAKPYLAQTQRMLADPAAALPWQPAVLHRGGWPDGA